jgi:hypothetical protein
MSSSYDISVLSSLHMRRSAFDRALHGRYWVATFPLPLDMFSKTEADLFKINSSRLRIKLYLPLYPFEVIGRQYSQ